MPLEEVLGAAEDLGLCFTRMGIPDANTRQENKYVLLPVS